jgi:hypothetical protein
MTAQVIQFPARPAADVLEGEAGELIERLGESCVPWEVEQHAAEALTARYRGLPYAKALEITKAAWLARAGL